MGKQAKDTLLKKAFKNNKNLVFFMVLGIAVIGVVVTALSRASTPSISLEVENGQLQNVAPVINDSTSSNGSHVVFGAEGECSPLETVGCTGANSSGIFFKESFNNNQPAPLNVVSREDLLPRWYAQPTMEAAFGFGLKPEPMIAQHGPDCGRPYTWEGGAWDGVTVPQGFHKITEFEETVFMCKDHLMTAINPPTTGTSNGAVVLKPNHMVDLGKVNRGEIEEAIVRVDVSTLSSSDGDWWDIWLSSWDEQVIAPADHGHHQVGPPRDNSLRTAVVTFGREKKFWAHSFWQEGNLAGGQSSANIDERFFDNIRPFLNISDTRRDLYELRITKDKVKQVLKHAETGEIFVVDEFNMPYPGFLGDEVVVQFVHANYEPEKNGKVGPLGCDGCPESKIPSTWHWDNVEIYPAKEFEIVGTKEYMVYSNSPSKKVNFSRPAPANSRMLFSGITRELNGPMGVSFDGGNTFQTPELVKEGAGNGPHPDVYSVKTYTIDIPQGTTSVVMTGKNGGWPVTSEGPCDPTSTCWGAFNFHLVARKS